MLYIDDIRGHSLDSNMKYLVIDNIRCRRYVCTLEFQTDFIYLFKIIDTKVSVNKICISKVDYYLNNNLIKAAEFQKQMVST
ncbi:hypothetical protein [Sedimentibacter sp. MB31-C6]|uniref:hypothetical protein n=1 Tax=Sedimentibacter sp. MB31-C6 TaxID=3109366 RepID=UPI002DDD567E|nr:hypothetical protein [Sedimentibacter sp. MB36-C1]WSI05121.1 hypothetical protein U8307_04835 [Sedimentibacter sp. MB36-C1]